VIDAILRPDETVEHLRATFMQQVVYDPSGCWLWRGVRDQYGQFRGRAAHRVSWALHQGPIPDNLDLLHGCNLAGPREPARGCVNPAHLRPGTPSENARDHRRAKEQQRAAERAAEEAEFAERIRARGRAALEAVCPDALENTTLSLEVPRWVLALLPRSAGEMSCEQHAREWLEEIALRVLDQENGRRCNWARLYVLQSRLEAGAKTEPERSHSGAESEPERSHP